MVYNCSWILLVYLLDIILSLAKNETKGQMEKKKKRRIGGVEKRHDCD